MAMKNPVHPVGSGLTRPALMVLPRPNGSSVIALGPWVPRVLSVRWSTAVYSVVPGADGLVIDKADCGDGGIC